MKGHQKTVRFCRDLHHETRQASTIEPSWSRSSGVSRPRAPPASGKTASVWQIGKLIRLR